MVDPYETEERLAIRMFDGGMTEREAVNAEKFQCEAIRRVEALRDKVRADKLNRRGVIGKDRAAGG